MQKQGPRISIAPMSSNPYDQLMDSLALSTSKHLLDDHFTLLEANERYFELFGYTRASYEADFDHLLTRFHDDYPEDWHALVDTVKRSIACGQEKCDCVCRMRHRDGRKLWVRLVDHLSEETVERYGCPCIYAVMMDITEHMQSRVDQMAVCNHVPSLIVKYRVTEQGLQFLDGNAKFTAFFGAGRDIDAGELAHGACTGVTREWHALLRTGVRANCEFSTVNQAGQTARFRMSGECTDFIGGDPVYLLVYDDITTLVTQNEHLAQANAALERIAYIDPVTGGLNRAKFELTVGNVLQTAAPGAYVLVWLNLQKFKLINDQGGSATGDRALKYIHDTIARRLAEGEYLARLAADNFVLLLKAGTKAQIAARLNKFASDVNRFNQQKKDKYILTFTAGVYLIGGGELSVTKLEDRANAARKSTSLKKVERAQLCVCGFYNEMVREKLMREKEIENRMRDALANHEFEVYLQPKLSLKEDRIVGAEALVRWNDPRVGLIAPDAFIPLFEKNGFIVQMDLYVFECVCRMIKGWLDAGREAVRVSVNLSRVHFSNANFLDAYLDLRKKYAVPAHLIELEFTETMVFENPTTFVDVISQLHRHGFTCSIDDFGSGYSSLNALKDMDVDVLKLDKAFFTSRDMDNSRERTMIRSVINLAKDLTMSTVAEGVETQPQADFLRETDCDLLQGFVFSRPVTIPTFEKLLWP
ncbi:MAG: EAL domain-containing protein [Clostridia bacterium]